MAINNAYQIVEISVNTVGSAGSAVGASTSLVTVTGYLEAVQLDYHTSAPATTDVNVNEVNGLGRVLLTIADNKTDAVYYPRPFVHGVTGAASTTNVTRYYLSGAHIQIAVAGSDPLTGAVVARLLISGV
jgi:hypothetical protein